MVSPQTNTAYSAGVSISCHWGGMMFGWEIRIWGSVSRRLARTKLPGKIAIPNTSQHRSWEVFSVRNRSCWLSTNQFFMVDLPFWKGRTAVSLHLHVAGEPECESSFIVVGGANSNSFGVKTIVQHAWHSPDTHQWTLPAHARGFCPVISHQFSFRRFIIGHAPR